MGCGNSKGMSAKTPRPEEPMENPIASNFPKTTPSSANELDNSVSPKPTPSPSALPPVLPESKGFVVFDIPLNSNNNSEECEIDKILKRPLPPRLKHLQPLENMPRLTAEQLEEKLRKVEEKRERMLARRRESGKFKSKRLMELQKAKEEQKEQQQLVGDEHIRNKIQSADRNRELRLQEIQEKQRIREFKAKQTREKAKKMREIDNLVDYEIERYDDNEGNHSVDSDTDSWLNEENNRKRSERLDSGLDKQSSGYNSRDLSASTQCSTDPPTRIDSGKTEVTLLEVGGGVVRDADDFFD